MPGAVLCVPGEKGRWWMCLRQRLDNGTTRHNTPPRPRLSRSESTIGLVYAPPSQLASALAWGRRWAKRRSAGGPSARRVTRDPSCNGYSSTRDAGYRRLLRAATFRFRPTTPPDCGQRRWTRSADADRPAEVSQDRSAEQPPSRAVTFVSGGVLQSSAQTTLA